MMITPINQIKFTRTCIYPKDIQRLTGKSERYARKVLARIKKDLGKEKHQFVTIEEYSRASGIDVETIRKYIW